MFFNQLKPDKFKNNYFPAFCKALARRNFNFRVSVDENI